MKASFLALPAALRAEILRRIAASAASLMLFAVILIFGENTWLGASIAIFAAVFTAMALTLIRCCLSGRYVAVRGICIEVERSRLRRRIRTVTVSAPPHTVKLFPRCRVSGIAAGDTVTLYMSDKAPVYEYNGQRLIDGCIAIEFVKGCSNEK